MKKIVSVIIILALLCQTSMQSIAFEETSENTASNVMDDFDNNYIALIRGIIGDSICPNDYGVWISTHSQVAFLEMINSIGNCYYWVSESGYLNVSPESELNIYDEKILELMNCEKTIIIDISNTYNAYNNITEKSFTMSIEDGDFALLFSPTSNYDIVVLNYTHYVNRSDTIIADESEFDDCYFYSYPELMNYFLNVFYPDTDFIQLTKNVELTIEEQQELLTDDSEIEYQANPTKVISSSSVLSTYDDIDIASIGLQETSALNINDIEENSNIVICNEDGIKLNESSANTILNFINTHSCYTYSINSNGLLQCDYTEKDNPYLDFSGETEVDKELKFVMDSEWKITIDISDHYYLIEDDMLKQVYFPSDEYVRTYSDNEIGKRVVILNAAYFNEETTYNPALSDRFVKNLFSKEYLPQTLSIDGASATMNVDKTVYFGPSSENYATVGSVDSGEEIVILGKTIGWYFIVYVVGSTSTFKAGYVPIETVSNVSGPVYEEIFEGGFKYCNSKLTVKSTYLFDYSVNSGTIYAGEGFTELDCYNINGSIVSLVEFSTPSGTKRGFVDTSNLVAPEYGSSVARVIASSAPAYSGPDSSYVKLGGVYKDEYVSILASEEDFFFVEYNTKSGRKRGYIKCSNLENCYIRTYSNFENHNSLKKATEELIVYGGPNANYANIGTIFNQEIISYLSVEKEFSYIEYTTSNGAKRGYVSSSCIVTTPTPTIPEIPVYENFSWGAYGYSPSRLSQMKWYKIGNGPNIVFAIFEQHGWEDAWAADGVELVKIANTMMSNLSTIDQANLDGWTIYVIPCANPDGITDGFTNNGPGRCAVLSKVDMNRCWEAAFTPHYTSRNYTGAEPWGAAEARMLRDFIDSKWSTATNIVLDIHGWLNKTYGDSQVGSYFGEQFGFSHTSTFGSGYLATWASHKGGLSCLLEFPMPSSSAEILSEDYAGKLTNGLLNMIDGLSNNSDSEGGSAVNEFCRIETDSSVNIYSGPGTSYNIVSSLTDGSTVTRTIIGVTSAVGGIWDKIELSDGTIGYIDHNCLVLIVDSGYTKYELYDDIGIIKAYLKQETTYYTGAVDKEYNNELIDAVEEYQKSHSISYQDGSLDKATLQQMGFSVNSDDRIVYNDYSRNYLMIAYQYWEGNYFDNATERNTYIYNQSSPSLDNKYITHKEKRDALWNTMSETERETLEASLKESLRKVNQAIIDYSELLPHAAAALGRFVDTNNFGETLTFSNYEEIFTISDSLFDLRNTFIDRNMRAAEHFTTWVNSATFSINNYIGAETGYSLSRNHLDWFMGVNGFVFGTSAIVVRNNDTYTMALTFNMRDYYDWAAPDEDPMAFPIAISSQPASGDVTVPAYIIVETINEVELYNLHRAGMGHNFETQGSFTLNLTWTKGQTYEDIKETL